MKNKNHSKFLRATFDDLIESLYDVPDVNNGGCGIVAYSIGIQLQKLKEQSLLPDVEIEYCVVVKGDSVSEHRYVEFERSYLNYSLDDCYRLFDEGVVFEHVMLKVTLDKNEFFVDGRNYFYSFEDYCEVEENPDLTIAYQTKNHTFMEKFAHDVSWWNLEQFEEPIIYIQEIKEIIAEVFEPLKEQLEKLTLKSSQNLSKSRRFV